MGKGSAKKAAAKSGSSPAEDRRSKSKALKSENSGLNARLKVEATTPSPTKVSPSSTSQWSTPKDAVYSHRLPTDQQRRGNGRVAGRSLIVWNRPRMAEKLLLHLQYECVRHKVQIPWDAIAHRFHPGSSGGAVSQQLTRLRRELISEGHLVPPLAHKVNSIPKFDPNIRGYVRAYEDGDDKETTRPVMFDERLDDRKFNLPDAFGLLDDDEEESQSPACLGSIYDDDHMPESPTPISRNHRVMAASTPSSSERFAHRLTSTSMGPMGGDGEAGSQGLTETDDLCGDVSVFTSPQARSNRSFEDESRVQPYLLDPNMVYPQQALQGRPPTEKKPEYPIHVAMADLQQDDAAPPMPNGNGAALPRTPYDMYGMGQPGYFPWHMGFPMPYNQYNHMPAASVPKHCTHTDKPIQSNMNGSPAPTKAEGEIEPEIA